MFLNSHMGVKHVKGITEWLSQTIKKLLDQALRCHGHSHNASSHYTTRRGNIYKDYGGEQTPLEGVEGTLII